MQNGVRLLVLGACLACSLIATAQRREGVYAPSGGNGTPWKINANHTLIWGGQPYMPVGVRVDGTTASIEGAKNAGVEDVVVDLPANGNGWESAIRDLEDRKMRYLLRITSLAPMARGFSVEPQSYRVTGVKKPRVFDFELPGATSAFVVLAAQIDGTIAESSRIPVINGKLRYEAKPRGELDHVVLVYPETSSLEQIDLWDRLDDQRDQLLGSLKRRAPGLGLRGIVNPMGKTLGTPGRGLKFVPTSPFFRMEFRESLERRYRSLSAALASWGVMANDLESFDELARLVPLWQGSRGVFVLLDPQNNRTYTVQKGRDNAWRDISEAIASASSRRTQRFVNAVRGVVDVPVVQEWDGWSATYEVAEPSVDGIGLRSSGTTQSELLSSAGRATSSILRWTSAGWLPATDIESTSTDGQVLSAVLDDLGSLGARGFFVRADTPESLKLVASEAARRNADTSLSETSPTAVFFPENATNPATPQRLPGGKWWLPAPSDGNRIDLGSQYFAYRMRQPGLGDAVALWARTPGRVKLLMLNTKGVGFQTVDGSDAAPKIVKGGIEVALTEFPILIVNTQEIPIPQRAFDEALLRFKSLSDEAEKTRREVSSEKLAFRDFLEGFDRNPSGNFPQMRRILTRLAYRVGRYTWIEAEESRESNFSEPSPIGGCSGTGALVLSSRFNPGADGFYADYTFGARTTEEQEVWVAARIPRELRERVQLRVGSQLLPLIGEPIGLYGDGFGWYRLGSTRLAAGETKVRFAVLGSDVAELAIDVILLTPYPFKPSAVGHPDPLVYPVGG